MKLGETGQVVSAYANGLELAGAPQPAANLRSIAGLLNEFADRTMAELVESGKGVRPQPSQQESTGEGARASDVAQHLEALERTLNAGRASVTQTRDLVLLIKLLRSDSGYLLSMLEALRRALTPSKPEKDVLAFIEALKAEIGNDRFEQIFAELADSALQKEAVVEIARAVYGGIPKKTSRKAALAFIRKPHDAYLSAKRGIDAMGGRSAA